MPMLQVTDFPADIYNRISAQALRENISFEQELITLLKNCLPSQDTENQVRRRAVFQRIKARNVSPEVKDVDVVKLIKEMREDNNLARSAQFWNK